MAGYPQARLAAGRSESVPHASRAHRRALRPPGSATPTVVIPALVYALWVSREERFSVTATPEGDGSRLKFGGDPGYRGINQDTYRRFVQLAQAQQTDS
jgi:hypothetical protein